jgi:hypothetical protein
MNEIDEYKPCLKCGRPGIEKPGETLPDNGVLIKVIHTDGNICEFAEYPSVSTFFVRDKRSQDPKIMKCPVCGKMGRINSYRPDKDKRFYKWKYQIVHEQLEGYWGKKQKVKKYRRCYMKTDDQRDKVLKRLGRYQ